MKLVTAASYLLLVSSHVTANDRRPSNNLRKLQGQSVKFQGTLTEVLVDYEDGSDDQYFSIDFPDGRAFRTDITPDWVKENGVVPGKTQIEVEGFQNASDNQKITNSKATVLNGGSTNRELAEEERRRELTDRSTGTKTVLAVRIEDASRNTGEQAPSYNEFQLADSVFGNLVGGTDPVNLASQYKACSYNQLNFTPMGPRTSNDIAKATNIANGVVTVYVNTGCTTNACDSTLHNAATTAIYNAFGAYPYNMANHVMYCLPPNAMSGIAYANLPGWRSVYKDNWCRYVSGQMHELGHNIRFHHANEGGTYQDQSGMMGYSYGQLSSPVMCFNAAKSWESDWYNNNKETFNADGIDTDLLVTLKGIATIDINNPGETALVKINNPSSSEDYYINFNHKVGFNSGTVEGGNQVMVMRAGNEGNGGAQSYLLAKLNAGGSWTGSINGQDITVKVNSLSTTTGEATICISRAGFICGGCISDAACDDGLFCNGAETCNLSTGACVTGTPVTCADDGIFCNGQEVCDEATDSCVNTGNPCPLDDGNACNGVESCNEITDECETTPAVDCTGELMVCGASKICDPANGLCINDPSNPYGEDGVCGLEEDCTLCPTDCTLTGGFCGDGFCGDGENCSNCGVDCPGQQGGKPANRYCCSGGSTGGCSGQGCSGVVCNNADTTACCGDGVCDLFETELNCGQDCQPAVCGDSICATNQEDCESCPLDCGACLCGDGDCNGDETCSSCQSDCGSCCLDRGAGCIANSECCSGNCKRNGSCA